VNAFRDGTAVSVEDQFHPAQMNGLAVLKERFPHRGAVDKSAVGGPQVFNQHALLSDIDLAMRGGNRPIVEFEIVGESAPDEIGAGLELDFPSRWRTGID
jgi:hypothetical protein